MASMDVDLDNFDDLDDVDDLLMRPGRGREKKLSYLHGCQKLCCSRTCIRLLIACLFSFALGGAIGHISIRYRTTDSALYEAANFGDEYKTKFLVVGDWGRKGEFNQRDVALQMALVGEMLRPDFIVSTGDNFYPSGLKKINDSQIFESFQDVYSYPSQNVPWYSVLGNHDYGDGSGKNDYRTRTSYQSSEMFYDDRWICCGGRDFLNQSPSDLLDLFFLDTSPFVHKYYKEDWATNSGGILDEKDKTEQQIADLDLALERSVAPWKIVIGHHPVRSNGAHGDTPELLSVMPELLTRHKVNFYLNGHEHDMQDITEPDHPGLRYVTSGAGSKTRWETGSGKNKQKNFWTIAPGFVAIGLSDNQAKVQFWLMEGTMIYEYTLDRQA